MSIDTPAAPTHQAVVFSSPPGFRPLELDLYRPATGTGPFPVVVFIHGGGWRVGNRSAFGPAFTDWSPSPFWQLTEAGFAVVSIDYRLSAEAVFPAQLDDVRAAAQWLADNANRFSLDPHRLVLWGESAGGHLAALLALTAVATADFRIAGVVDWYGPADLATMQQQSRDDAVTRPDTPDSRESMLLGAPLAESPELAAAASPVTFVHAGAPAFYLVHGSHDRFVPTGQSEQLAAALTAVGVDARLRIIEGADHMWRDTTEVADIFSASTAFAREVTGA